MLRLIHSTIHLAVCNTILVTINFTILIQVLFAKLLLYKLPLQCKIYSPKHFLSTLNKEVQCFMLTCLFFSNVYIYVYIYIFNSGDASVKHKTDTCIRVFRFHFVVTPFAVLLNIFQWLKVRSVLSSNNKRENSRTQTFDSRFTSRIYGNKIMTLRLSKNAPVLLFLSNMLYILQQDIQDISR